MRRLERASPDHQGDTVRAAELTCISFDMAFGSRLGRLHSIVSMLNVESLGIQEYVAIGKRLLTTPVPYKKNRECEVMLTHVRRHCTQTYRCKTLKRESQSPLYNRW